jgi:hypothetical protein
MSTPPIPLLGRIAVHLKLISVDQLAEATRLQGQAGGEKRPGEILVERGMLTPAQLEQVLRHRQQLIARQRAQAAVSLALPQLLALLRQGTQRGASDVHVHAGNPLRLRPHGRFETLGEGAIAPEAAEPMLRSALTPAQAQRFDERGEIDFAWTVPGLGRFRANVYRQLRAWTACSAPSPRACRRSRSSASRRAWPSSRTSTRGWCSPPGPRTAASPRRWPRWWT